MEIVKSNIIIPNKLPVNLLIYLSQDQCGFCLKATLNLIKELSNKNKKRITLIIHSNDNDFKSNFIKNYNNFNIMFFNNYKEIFVSERNYYFPLLILCDFKLKHITVTEVHTENIKKIRRILNLYIEILSSMEYD